MGKTFNTQFLNEQNIYLIFSNLFKVIIHKGFFLFTVLLPVAGFKKIHEVFECYVSSFFSHSTTWLNYSMPVVYNARKILWNNFLMLISRNYTFPKRCSGIQHAELAWTVVFLICFRFLKGRSQICPAYFLRSFIKLISLQYISIINFQTL